MNLPLILAFAVLFSWVPRLFWRAYGADIRRLLRRVT